MKNIVSHKLLILCFMCAFPSILIANHILVKCDFGCKNNFGDSILYRFIEDSSALCVSQMMDDEVLYQTDSLVIPDSVRFENAYYPVKSVLWGAFLIGPSHVKSITLPSTFQSINLYLADFWLPGVKIANPFTSTSPFSEIIVANANNTYYSEDGVLYNKKDKELYAFPPNKQLDTLVVKEGIEKIGNAAFSNAKYLNMVILPNTLKILDDWCFVNSAIQSIVLKDSVTYLGKNSLSTSNCRNIVLGAGLKTFHPAAFEDIWNDGFEIYVTCKALLPPLPEADQTDYIKSMKKDFVRMHLRVPRKSISEYRNALGWENCLSIYPIEPPIVSGVNEAEVSWVQNFSATGYVLTLYLDEARTQPYLQLTFDKDGHLTNIDLNRPNVPLLPAEEGDSEPAQRYAEYYSFTITGLDANTKYYYTRQSLAGEKVIDEETGSFETLPDGAPTGVNPLLFEPSPQKTFENGMLRIRKNDNTYNVNGTIVE